MLAVPCSFRQRAIWRPNPPHNCGSFIPRGKTFFSDREAKVRLNPVHGWTSGDAMWSARFFVGFNVGGVKKWNMEYLVSLVKEIRRQQKKDADSTFLYTRGVYTHRTPDGKRTGQVVTEDGAQIVILNLDEREKPEAFRRNMFAIAEEVRERLEQDEVIVELQYGAVPISTAGLKKKGTSGYDITSEKREIIKYGRTLSDEERDMEKRAEETGEEFLVDFKV